VGLAPDAAAEPGHEGRIRGRRGRAAERFETFELGHDSSLRSGFGGAVQHHGERRRRAPEGCGGHRRSRGRRGSAATAPGVAGPDAVEGGAQRGVVTLDDVGRIRGRRRQEGERPLAPLAAWPLLAPDVVGALVGGDAQEPRADTAVALAEARKRLPRFSKCGRGHVLRRRPGAQPTPREGVDALDVLAVQRTEGIHGHIAQSGFTQHAR
jgi:hypothetical protein